MLGMVDTLASDAEVLRRHGIAEPDEDAAIEVRNVLWAMHDFLAQAGGDFVPRDETLATMAEAFAMGAAMVGELSRRVA